MQQKSPYTTTTLTMTGANMFLSSCPIYKHHYCGLPRWQGGFQQTQTSFFFLFFFFLHQDVFHNCERRLNNNTGKPQMTTLTKPACIALSFPTINSPPTCHLHGQRSSGETLQMSFSVRLSPSDLLSIDFPKVWTLLEGWTHHKDIPSFGVLWRALSNMSLQNFPQLLTWVQMRWLWRPEHLICIILNQGSKIQARTVIYN